MIFPQRFGFMVFLFLFLNSWANCVFLQVTKSWCDISAFPKKLRNHWRRRSEALAEVRFAKVWWSPKAMQMRDCRLGETGDFLAHFLRHLASWSTAFQKFPAVGHWLDFELSSSNSEPVPSPGHSERIGHQSLHLPSCQQGKPTSFHVVPPAFSCRAEVKLRVPKPSLPRGSAKSGFRRLIDKAGVWWNFCWETVVFFKSNYWDFISRKNAMHSFPH